MSFNFSKALKVVETALLQAVMAKQDRKITIGEIRDLSFSVVKEVLKALGWWKLTAFTIGDKDIIIGALVEASNRTAETWLDILGLENHPVVELAEEEED